MRSSLGTSKQSESAIYAGLGFPLCWMLKTLKQNITNITTKTCSAAHRSVSCNKVPSALAYLLMHLVCICCNRNAYHASG